MSEESEDEEKVSVAAIEEIGNVIARTSLCMGALIIAVGVAVALVLWVLGVHV